MHNQALTWAQQETMSLFAWRIPVFTYVIHSWSQKLQLLEQITAYTWFWNDYTKPLTVRTGNSQRFRCTPKKFWLTQQSTKSMKLTLDSTCNMIRQHPTSTIIIILHNMEYICKLNLYLCLDGSFMIVLR